MNANEITNERLRLLANGDMGAYIDETTALARAELARRAQYWRHGNTRDGFMTIDGMIVSYMVAGEVREAVARGVKLNCSECLKNEITADEWVALQRVEEPAEPLAEGEIEPTKYPPEIDRLIQAAQLFIGSEYYNLGVIEAAISHGENLRRDLDAEREKRIELQDALQAKGDQIQPITSGRLADWIAKQNEIIAAVNRLAKEAP